MSLSFFLNSACSLSSAIGSATPDFLIRSLAELKVICSPSSSCPGVLFSGLDIFLTAFGEDRCGGLFVPLVVDPSRLDCF